MRVQYAICAYASSHANIHLRVNMSVHDAISQYTDI